MDTRRSVLFGGPNGGPVLERAYTDWIVTERRTIRRRRSNVEEFSTDIEDFYKHQLGEKFSDMDMEDLISTVPRAKHPVKEELISPAWEDFRENRNGVRSQCCNRRNTI